MMSSLPSINLGELTKPATVLIQKISDAVGGLAKPWQIERIAKAEARAAVITANVDVEIDDLKRRALVRLVNEEAKRQRNMESIIAESLPLLESGADPAQMDDDWIEHLFDHSRHISDTEMQRYWAHLLAQEANAPGKFSKHTINILSSMTAREARLFRSLSAAFLRIDNESIELREGKPKVPCILLHDVNTQYVRRFYLTHDDMVALESLSLIKLAGSNEYCFSYEPDKLHVEIEYRDEVAVVPLDSDGDVYIGFVIFTRWGEELSELFEWETSSSHWAEIKGSLPSRDPKSEPSAHGPMPE
jgi:hypothetical protein